MSAIFRFAAGPNLKTALTILFFAYKRSQVKFRHSLNRNGTKTPFVVPKSANRYLSSVKSTEPVHIQSTFNKMQTLKINWPNIDFEFIFLPPGVKHKEQQKKKNKPNYPPPAMPHTHTKRTCITFILFSKYH